MGSRSPQAANVLLAVRVGLPILIAVVGTMFIVLARTGNERAVGMGLVGVAVMVVIANWFIRLGLASERDREDEDEARRRFDRTGRWDD